MSEKIIIGLPGMPFFRICTSVHPPLKGWVLRYISGPEEVEALGIKQGYFLTLWFRRDDGYSVDFEPEMHMAFESESGAQHAADILRDADIETEILVVGLAQSAVGGS